MMAQNFVDRIELSYWKIVIFLLSNSQLAKKVYRYGYELKQSNISIAWIPAMVIGWAGVGLLAGYVAGRMGVSLW